MIPVLKQSNEQRVAILLASLGDDLGSQILKNFPPERAAAVRGMISELDEDGVDDVTVADVLEEFERFLRFAEANRPAPLKIADVGDGKEPEAKDIPAAEKKNQRSRKSFTPTGDPVADLNQMSPYQIAKALDGEHPRAASVVMLQLDNTVAARTLDLLPDEVRAEAFLQMSREQASPQILVERIVITTLEKALKIEEPEGGEIDADQRAAALLRSVDKGSRTQMIDALQAENSEMADRVRGLLYVFDDMLRITPRSVQKLLGEFDVDTLSSALKGAPQEMVDSVLNNLSKRARERLAEEIELAQSTPEIVEAARRQITDAMGRLDQAGELQMIE